MRIPSLLATITALAVTAVACSGGDDDTSNTTEPSAATTTSTIPTTATAASTTTTTEAATTTTSNAPTSTTEATTSTSEPVDEVQRVVEAYEAAWSAFGEALFEPDNQDIVESTRQLLTGSMLELLDQRVAEFRTENLRAVPNPEVPARFEIDRESIVIDGDTATMRVCDVDSIILVEIGAAPDGSDAIVNEDVVARLVDTTMERSESGWLLSNGVFLQEYYDQDHCP